MSHRSSKGKDIVTDDPSTPVAKRTRLSSQSSQDFNLERFRTSLTSHIYSNIFDKASPVVERVVEFDTLGTTFIPRIFGPQDWENLFGNFVDPMDELVKECYSNTSDLEVELICWVRGKEFAISPNSIANILCITRPQNVDLTPYDDWTPETQDILQVLGSDHEVSSTGTSISTAKFAPELTTLKLIMFSNLYPLSNTTFINLGRAQFLCDLITGAPIDICAHIFQTIRKALFLPQMEKCWPICVQFPCSLYKPVEVIPLKHQRVHTYLRLLHLLLSQRHLYIPHLLRVSSLKFHKLAFRKHSLILKLIEWVVCLKIFRNTLMKWWHFSTPPTTMFKCDSRPWRIS